RADGGDDALGGEAILDRDRHAVQRTQRFTGGLTLVGRGRFFARSLRHQLYDGVELAVHAVDGVEADVDRVTRRQVAGTNAAGQCGGAIDHDWGTPIGLGTGKAPPSTTCCTIGVARSARRSTLSSPSACHGPRASSSVWRSISWRASRPAPVTLPSSSIQPLSCRRAVAASHSPSVHPRLGWSTSRVSAPAATRLTCDSHPSTP